MPTSARGNNASHETAALLIARRHRRRLPSACARGFTLIELMVVVAVIAIVVGLVGLALRDAAANQLDREGARLAALLESARAEARVLGLPVRWSPSRENAGEHFRFAGLPDASRFPRHWLDARVVVEVIDASAVLLGPEPILPPQRIRLRLEGRTLDITSDGLAPFAPAPAVESPG